MVASLAFVAALGGALAHGSPTVESQARHAEPSHPARVNWLVDGVVTGLAGGTYMMLRNGLPEPRPHRFPLGAPSAVRLDRVALGRFSPQASRTSDVVLTATVVAPVVLNLIEASIETARFGGDGRARWFFKRSGTDLLLYTEAMAINAMVTTGIKRVIPRTRPFGHLTLADVDDGLADELIHDQARSNVNESFLSGHTSWAFTAATVGATLFTLKLRTNRTPAARAAVGLTWVVSVGAATTVATLRVVAGRHYPTDVLAGAALGTLIGVSVPLLHLRRGPRAFQVGAHGGRGVTGLQLHGSF